MPTDIQAQVTVEVPGEQNNRGSGPHVVRRVPRRPSCACSRPTTSTGSTPGTPTWTRYDKIVFDDLKQNATLAAMLVYMASEDPERVTRETANLPTNGRTGQPREFGPCRAPQRTPR